MTYARPGRAGTIEPRSAPSAQRRHATLARLVGAAGLILLTWLLFWMLTDDAFRVSDADVAFRGLTNADESAVRAKLSDLDRRPNVFRVRASEIVSELSTLAEVDSAHATVTLPANVTVQLDERDPVFVWSDGATSWLVDEQGMLFAPVDEITAATSTSSLASGNAETGADTDAPSGQARAFAARAGLPVVEDGRSRSEEPTVGMHLASSDLAVMRQLLALTPELLGSRSRQLRLRVDEADGYVLKSEDRGWSAQFGHYNPTLQPPTVIPRQVQCLQWVLASYERKLEQVRLALSDEACGTFTTFE